MKNKNYLLLLLVPVLLSCSDPNEETGKAPESSWEVIQSQIFEPNCNACHSQGSSFARQSNLLLTADVGYEQLVNRLPDNEAARNDGLELVGTTGLESLLNSFLWEKINYPDFEHFYEDHPDYGELMPYGGPALTNGELEYIRQWILAGAPRTGFVAENNLLGDTERFEIPDEDFQPLPMPESGIQLSIGPFDVLPGTEREFFYFQPLENEQALYVNEVEISMRAGSHHFILYDFPFGNIPEAMVYRDLYTNTGEIDETTASSLLNQRFVSGTQWRVTDYHFPSGVALKIPAQAGLDMNSHYVNRSAQAITGEVYVNLHTLEESEVVYVAENIFESYEDFQLPPNRTTTITRSSIFNERRHIFQLFSHAHEHMVEFKIFIEGGERDGELVYLAKDWEHPPLLEIDPPLVLESGQGLRSEATYNNTTDRTLGFGLRSTDEMMIVLGAYYTEN